MQVCIYSIRCDIQVVAIVFVAVFVITVKVEMVPSVVIVLIVAMEIVANIGADALADADGNTSASVVTALGFAVPKPSREFSW